MAKPYAYICSSCKHLASRHLSTPGAVVVEGPYACTHRGCGCEISQTAPMYGIDEAAFNRLYLPDLENYDKHQHLT